MLQRRRYKRKSGCDGVIGVRSRAVPRIARQGRPDTPRWLCFLVGTAAYTRKLGLRQLRTPPSPPRRRALTCGFQSCSRKKAAAAAERFRPSPPARAVSSRHDTVGSFWNRSAICQPAEQAEHAEHAQQLQRRHSTSDNIKQRQARANKYQSQVQLRTHKLSTLSSNRTSTTTS